MSDEEIRLEAAKLAVQCFVGCNGDRRYNNFSKNVTMLYDYIKNGKLPIDDGSVSVLPSMGSECRHEMIKTLEKVLGKNCVLFRNIEE